MVKKIVKIKEERFVRGSEGWKTNRVVIKLPKGITGKMVGFTIEKDTGPKGLLGNPIKIDELCVLKFGGKEIPFRRVGKIIEYYSGNKKVWKVLY